eukprot:363192-Chlamydomonas_euryale.AAC.5
MQGLKLKGLVHPMSCQSTLSIPDLAVRALACSGTSSLPPKMLCQDEYPQPWLRRTIWQT